MGNVDTKSLLARAKDALYNSFEPDNQCKLWYDIDAALRQSAAPSGGAALWNAAKERERLALQIAEDLMAQNMLNVPCVNAFHLINARLFAQESKTGAVTETK